ncbi:MAG: nitronate monooxygenase [Actinomycetota bacterium]|nr:nitronate monooxygenase [Actinomycetota bacterium]
MAADPLTTPLCALLGLTAPVVQAPVGSAAVPELAAAVSTAGGLGMLALSWTKPAALGKVISRTRELTERPFGVNLALEWDQHERLQACLDAGAGIVSTFWGDPAPYVSAIHDAGALHLHTVGSAAEARNSVDIGVDVIVAQGYEAGGHVWGQVTTLALVPVVVDAVDPIPVIAAGGIGDGRGLAAVLVLGAQAAWIGTRFLLADEARVHDVYRDAIIRASETDTVYGTAFDLGWPDAPHRTLPNATTQAWEAAGRPAAPDRPGEGETVARTSAGQALLRYSDAPPLPGMTGDVAALALYAGQSAGLVRARQPAAEIVRELVDDAGRILNRGR